MFLQYWSACQRSESVCNDRDDDQDELREMTEANQSISSIPAVSNQIIDMKVSLSIPLSEARFYDFSPDANTLLNKAIKFILI